MPVEYTEHGVRRNFKYLFSKKAENPGRQTEVDQFIMLPDRVLWDSELLTILCAGLTKATRVLVRRFGRRD